MECQGDWIIDALAKLRKENITYLNATRVAEKDWNRKVTELSDKTLFPISDSWYMGANIPGKKREQLCVTRVRLALDLYANISLGILLVVFRCTKRNAGRCWTTASRGSRRRHQQPRLSRLKVCIAEMLDDLHAMA